MSLADTGIKKGKALSGQLDVVTTAQALKSKVKSWKQAGETVAFVPTMGNLHAGHLELVKAAKTVADRVIVSIFVNPTQFGESDDFGTYPRTLEEDISKLKNLSVDSVFSPLVEEIYPESITISVDKAILEAITGLSGSLEGEFRPGFFDGVVTVVHKLFEIVEPDIAVFGEKDYQQLLVIEKMVSCLNMPIKILAVPTVREANGLAMSSRNGYLQNQEKQLAAGLYSVLQALVTSIQSGVTITSSENEAIEQLEKQNFDVDYVSVRKQVDLTVADSDDELLIVLAAIRIGETRLIDNLQFNRTGDISH